MEKKRLVKILKNSFRVNVIIYLLDLIQAKSLLTKLE